MAMINRFSNLINRKRSAAKRLQVLCSTLDPLTDSNPKKVTLIAKYADFMNSDIDFKGKNDEVEHVVIPGYFENGKVTVSLLVGPLVTLEHD